MWWVREKGGGEFLYLLQNSKTEKLELNKNKLKERIGVLVQVRFCEGREGRQQSTC